jgi:carboxylate-amine ligase
MASLKSSDREPRAPLEDLTFQPSVEPTLGVELELQILERESGDLAPGAVRILDACRDANIEGVSGEFLLSMLEVRTEVCSSVADVAASLVPRLRGVRNIASSLGFDLAVGGTHPYGRPGMNAIFPAERYQRIQKQQGSMAYEEAIFGLHVHVGVPGGDQAIGAINLLVEYLPHLLALSANSPFWRGIDTGYASARMRMFRPSSGSGMPPQFGNWQEFADSAR